MRTVILSLCLLLGVSGAEVKADTENFYIREQTGQASARSFDNSSKLPVSSVRYEKFTRWDGLPNEKENPNMAMGIKYIEGDNKNADGGGKWRYVYCTEFAKTSPTAGIEMNFQGWARKEVTYALYYGAVYYGEPCRYEPYSTGDWRMDYFVTQVAIHLLNEEYTMDAVKKAMNKSEASPEEISLACDRIEKIVNGAKNQNNYGGFTAGGWVDLSNSTFLLKGYQDAWYYDAGKYVSSGTFHTEFQGYQGYEFREQLTDYTVQTEEGVEIRKKGKAIYADFDLAVDEALYKKWQLTGKEIPVNVTTHIPCYWGAGIYSAPDKNDIQNVCFLTWGSAGGVGSFSKSVVLHIPKVTQSLAIQKKDAETGDEIEGASFSLWAFDGNAYSSKAGNFEDQGGGKYICKDVDYTSTTDGRFLIREDSAPRGYDVNYLKENPADEEDYQRYGGRQIRMNENGFWSDTLSDPFAFRDKKLTPEADLSVMKYDIDNGGNLEDAEFSVYEWDSVSEKYKDTPMQILEYNKTELKYKTKQSLIKNKENGGKFLISETRLPKGYHCPWNQEITVTEPGLTVLELEAPNYPGRTVTVYKKILKEEVNWEHGNPTFFFKITGKDLEGKNHTCHCFVEFTQELAEGQQGKYIIGKTKVSDIPAGIYQVEELEDVMRYILTDAVSAQENVQVQKQAEGSVNGVEKIQAVVTADLRLKDGSITFENRKVLYDEYSDNAVTVNHFVLSS